VSAKLRLQVAAERVGRHAEDGMHGELEAWMQLARERDRHAFGAAKTKPSNAMKDTRRARGVHGDVSADS